MVYLWAAIMACLSGSAYVHPYNQRFGCENWTGGENHRQHIPISLLTRPNHFISDITMSVTDVYEALVALNPSKSMGYDSIGPRLLKFCALPLHEPLHHLFLLSLSQHYMYLPQDWWCT